MSYIHSSKFICAPEDWGLWCPEFKRTVVLRGEVASAVLEISALGVYECRINGERVGDAYMTPGWTAYSFRLQYQSYDVTDMLSEESEIIVSAGHGWFASRLGAPTSSKGVWGQRPAVIAALRIEYKDGGEDVILTDESWVAAKSKVTRSQIYDGESFDARIEPVFDTAVEIIEYDTDILPEVGGRVKEIERIAAKEVLVTPAGEVVVDFGQNLTGCVEFTIENAVGGECVKITCAEILDKDGNFYNENYRSAKSLTEYTAKAGMQTYKARHTFYGFRYIRLIDWCEEVRAENFTAIVMHTKMKRTGFFECGHEKLNKLYENIIWGQRGNFLDIPTDCPQRDERLGWTGDAQVFCRTASINYDTEEFFAKWLGDVAVEQRENGCIPPMVPFPFAKYGLKSGNAPHSDAYFKVSAAWADVATVAPWELYMAYGNRERLAEYYPMMTRWVEYMHSAGEEEYLWLGGNHYGDWLGLDAPFGSYKGSTNEDLIATAFFYMSAGLVIKAARVLGKDESEIGYFENMRKRVREAFIERFVSGERLVSDTQTAYVVAIHFGLCEGRPVLRNSFAKRLIELIEEAGDSLKTGFVGTPYLLDTLTEIGRVDKAYKLLLREEFPGWLFAVNMGATTVWEHWDGMRPDGSMWSKDMNSFNHYAYGSVAAWMYRVAAGIAATEDGVAYERIRIAPIPNRALGRVKASIDTRHGRIVSEWRYEGEAIRYGYEIPEGCTATVIIDGVERECGAGKYTVWGKAI